MKTVKTWDLFVRIFHWSLLVAIITQLITAEDYNRIHVKVGYFIVVLVVLRIIWGVVGSKHARFTDFIYPPSDIFGYLKGLLGRRAKHYLGHNPAGGAMVCFLLFFLVLTTTAGLLTYGAECKGPLAFRTAGIMTPAFADDDDKHGAYQGEGHRDGSSRETGRDHTGNADRVKFWKEIHETLAGILIFLACVHVCGVLASSYVHKENLILAMLTGKKKVE